MLKKEGRQVLQYGATEGDTMLREFLLKRYQSLGLKV